jgi:alpha-1,2-glucosyltransferase
VSTSTAVVLLLASSLSLITAPLVEPRYFIIPWVMWRLMVPAWRLPTSGLFASVQPTGPVGKLLEFFRHYDLRLVLETVWFVAINVVTGYIFLFKPFQWKAEDGSLLDEGRWQRFMW